MKRILVYLFPVVMLAMVSCKEEPPAINFQPDSKIEDTTYIKPVVPGAQDKTILLEDISGVKCVNCPDAATIARELAHTNEPNVVVVTIQPKTQGLESLTKPIDEDGVKTIRDMRTDVGANICALVGIPGSLPNGYINRKTLPGKLDPILGRDEWTAAVQGELLDSTPVNIELVAEYNQATTEMTVTAEITYTRAVTGKNYLSLAIVEDSIVDAQEKKEGIEIVFDQNYMHRHVLRDMFTNHSGDLLNTSDQITLVPGRYFKKVYSKKIIAFTTPKQFYVTGYVHQDATGKYVLHAHEVKVVLK